MRRTIGIKSCAYFVVFMFTWATLWSNAFYGEVKGPLSEAQELYNNRDYEKAIIALDEIIVVHADKSEGKNLVLEAYYLLSKIYFELREDAKMAESLGRLLHLEPDFVKAESNQTFFKVFENMKNDPLVKGHRLYRQRDYSGALVNLNEFVERNGADESKKPQLAFASYLLAKIAFDTRYEDQIDLHLQKVFEADPAFQITEADMAFKFRLDRARMKGVAKERASGMTKEKPAPIKAPEEGGKEMVKPEIEKPQVVLRPASESKLKKRKKFPWLLVGGIAVGIGVLALLFLKKDKNPSADAQTGSIGISSEPSGANVYLDGNKWGQVTPCLLPNVSIGMHALKIEHELCQAWEGQVEVKQQQTTRIAATLTQIVEFITKWPCGSWGIDVDRSGSVYAETGNSVSKFSSTGLLLTSWVLPPPEWNNYEVLGTMDVGVSNSNFVYVTQTSDEGPIQRVVKFTSSGRFVAKWGRRGNGNYEFDWPNAVAVDSHENVYVADCGNERIMKYNPNGSFAKKWATAHPWDICVDHSNYIYVAGNYSIKKFTSNGSFITRWGSQGSGDTQFAPYGITADRSNNIYVADCENHRIMKFSSTGSYVLKWGNQGKGDYQFDSPSKMAVDNSGFLYVTDTGNNRILKYRINSSASPTVTVSYSDKTFFPGSPLEKTVDVRRSTALFEKNLGGKD